MVALAFFIRFRAQLRRTRPELVSRLENAAAQAVQDAGGTLSRDRRLLRASFSTDSLGFWLDMLVCIERLLALTDARAADLYGYSLLIGGGTPDVPEALCRFLSGYGGAGGGVFLDGAAQAALAPYASIDAAEMRGTNGGGGLFRLLRLRVFEPAAAAATAREELLLRLREQAGRAFTQGRRALLIDGTLFAGKRDALYRLCAEIAGDFPPLFVRFGAQSSGGLTALADAWSVSSLVQGMDGAAEFDRLGGFLFRERLRDSLSPFVERKARRFCRLLFTLYSGAARRKGRAPVIIIENLHLAEERAAGILREAYQSALLSDTAPARQANVNPARGMLTLGTYGAEMSRPGLLAWQPIFPEDSILPLAGEGGTNTASAQSFVLPPAASQMLPIDLWQVAYACSLLGRYFPPVCFLPLFAEERKKPAMISRAWALLAEIGVIDTPLDPRPWPPDFDRRAEAALGKQAEQVRALVRGRLLDWVERRQLHPTFRLLSILAGLGGIETIDDQLILKAMVSDLANGTAEGFEAEMHSGAGFLRMLANRERRGVIRYVFTLMRALLAGTEQDIRAACIKPPECAAFPVLKTQLLVYTAACQISMRDAAAALETVKAAILLSQGKNRLCLAHCYRLFSLTSLARQKPGEALAYLGFAIDNAERSGDSREAGISACFQAALQFLVGNVSQAALLAQKARAWALAAACPEWADRARFFEGRFAFETGAYPEAMEIFDRLRTDPDGERTDEKERLFAAWAYRTQVYHQNPSRKKPVETSRDADIFEIEAACIAGNYHKAAELSTAAVRPAAGDTFLFTEQPDWSSGFAQCELLYFSPAELWERLITVYRSLSLCRLSPSGGEEARCRMQRILRSDTRTGSDDSPESGRNPESGRSPEIDPLDAFYYYVWYCILEQTGAGQIDMNTAVSMAYKRLQSRAGKIDDNETRRRFLSQPYWNKALNRAAKEFKLL
jgi:hypothetical protein